MLPLNGSEPGGHGEPASQPCAITSPMDTAGHGENLKGGSQEMKVDGGGKDVRMTVVLRDLRLTTYSLRLTTYY